MECPISKEAIEEFSAELFLALEKSVQSKDWADFEEMLNAWVATAEAMTNPETIELLHTDLSKEGVTRVE